MGSIASPSRKIEKDKKREPIGPVKSGAASAALWVVNLLVILFGWPFLLYGKLKYRKTDQFK